MYDTSRRDCAPQESPTGLSPPTSLTPPTSTYSPSHTEFDEYILAGVQNSPISSDGYVSDVSSGVKPVSPVWGVQDGMPISPESMRTVSTVITSSNHTAKQEQLFDLAQLLQGDFSAPPSDQIPSPSDVFIDLGTFNSEKSCMSKLKPTNFCEWVCPSPHSLCLHIYELFVGGTFFLGTPFFIVTW